MTLREKRYAIIWRESEDSPTWSTYLSTSGKVVTFTEDSLQTGDTDFDRRVSDTADLLPENAHKVIGLKLAVTSDVASEWLGWAVAE